MVTTGGEGRDVLIRLGGGLWKISKEALHNDFDDRFSVDSDFD
jgi:hypothetical protein